MVELTETNPSSGPQTRSFVRNALGRLETPERHVVIKNTVDNLGLIQRGTREVRKAQEDLSAKNRRKNRHREANYKSQLNAAWGGRCWLPPTSFVRRKTPRADKDSLAINQLSQLARLTALCAHVHVQLHSLYLPGGLLHDASIMLFGEGNLRWHIKVPRKALEMFQQRYPGVADKVGRRVEPKGNKPDLDGKKHKYSSGDDDYDDDGDEDNDSDDSDIEDKIGGHGHQVSSPPATPLARNACRSGSHALVDDTAVSPELVRSRDSNKDSPALGLELPDDSGYTVDDGIQVNQDPESLLILGTSPKSPWLHAESHHSDDDDPKDSYITVEEIGKGKSESDDGDRDKIREKEEEADEEEDHREGCITQGNSHGTPLELAVASESGSSSDPDMLQAIEQLRSGAMLTDNAIRALQKKMSEDMGVTSSVAVVDPLYFEPAVKLPARLPSLVRRGSVTTFYAVIHHQGPPKHWTLACFRTTKRRIDHYDSCPVLGAAKEVQKTAIPWLQEQLPGNPIAFLQLDGPRQSDSTSCGVFALVALMHLLGNCATLSNLRVNDDTARKVLLEMVTTSSPQLALTAVAAFQKLPSSPTPVPIGTALVPNFSLMYKTTASSQGEKQDGKRCAELLLHGPSSPKRRAIEARDPAPPPPSTAAVLAAPSTAPLSSPPLSVQPFSPAPLPLSLTSSTAPPAFVPLPPASLPVDTGPSTMRDTINSTPKTLPDPRAAINAIAEQITALDSNSKANAPTLLEHVQRQRDRLREAEQRDHEASRHVIFQQEALHRVFTDQANKRKRLATVSEWTKRVDEFASREATILCTQEGAAEDVNVRKIFEGHTQWLTMARKATEADVIGAATAAAVETARSFVHEAIGITTETAAAVYTAKQALEMAEAAYKIERDSEILRKALEAISREV
ncbi:hypothetical protein LZ30DRAFT_459869 [Colletotrichum cereale]|nr:hypothetical protein LZ30DRAFT_459869 [Colletotrichum cereale]